MADTLLLTKYSTLASGAILGASALSYSFAPYWTLEKIVGEYVIPTFTSGLLLSSIGTTFLGLSLYVFLFAFELTNLRLGSLVVINFFATLYNIYNVMQFQTPFVQFWLFFTVSNLLITLYAITQLKFNTIPYRGTEWQRLMFSVDGFMAGVFGISALFLPRQLLELFDGFTAFTFYEQGLTTIIGASLLTLSALIFIASNEISRRTVIFSGIGHLLSIPLLAKFFLYSRNLPLPSFAILGWQLLFGTYMLLSANQVRVVGISKAKSKEAAQSRA
jgi:hypothetical protein